MLKMQTLSPAGDVRAIETAPRSEAATGSPLLLSTALWPAALLGAMLLALYFRVVIKLVRDWIEIPDYSHGILIPFFVAFLIWDQRRALFSTPLKPSWFGLPLVAFGLFVLLVGVFGADLFLSRLSFLLLAAGIKFMFFVMFLAIPFPAVLLNHITFPLQLFASQVAAWVLPVFGVPVLQDGNIIRLPAMPLEVAEACSGIRSLMSLFTVAVIFGYFVERGTLRRTLLALASIPIAVAANVARIVGTGLCVQYWDPVKALGFFHEFSGWLMFLVSMSCLYVIHNLLSRFVPERRLAA